MMSNVGNSQIYQDNEQRCEIRRDGELNDECADTIYSSGPRREAITSPSDSSVVIMLINCSTETIICRSGIDWRRWRRYVTSSFLSINVLTCEHQYNRRSAKRKSKRSRLWTQPSLPQIMAISRHEVRRSTRRSWRKSRSISSGRGGHKSSSFCPR